MNTILKCCLVILLITVGSYAQQPAQAHFQQRLQSVVRSEGPPSTKNYRLELSIQRGEKTARYKLTLNSGGVTTELIDRFAKMNPLERLGTPEDIASAVAFLAGPDGGWINGQVLRANGGMV